MPEEVEFKKPIDEVKDDILLLREEIILLQNETKKITESLKVLHQGKMTNIDKGWWWY
tara:strand:- start:356 stop:529 length:174 start_codon:yes stop_codon:yes gene_type:complete